jgi:hypothetical protein
VSCRTSGWRKVHLCITSWPEGSSQSCGSLQTNRIALTGEGKQPQGMGERLRFKFFKGLWRAIMLNAGSEISNPEHGTHLSVTCPSTLNIA